MVFEFFSDQLEPIIRPSAEQCGNSREQSVRNTSERHDRSTTLSLNFKKKDNFFDNFLSVQNLHRTNFSQSVISIVVRFS